MSNTIARKQEHLDICLRESVETHQTFLSTIHLSHQALPELDLEEIDSSTVFLGQKTAYPFFISCMTGGSTQGRVLNMLFAELAEEFGIAVGIGSIRVLLENDSLFSDFNIKRVAQSVPVMANLGAAQLLSIDKTELFSVLNALYADALVLHLNPAQELCQEHGARNFRGIKEAIHECIHMSPVPVIVKETGMGMHPNEIKSLLSFGAKYVDIAGAGGTNWSWIELIRAFSQEGQELELERNKDAYLGSFENWGHPTALMLLANYGTPGLLASGGIRNARDILVSLALGAQSVGLALPFVQAAKDGRDSLKRCLDNLGTQVRQLMLLCGAKSVSDLSRVPFWLDAKTQVMLQSYCGATRTEVPKFIRSLCTSFAN